MTTNKNNIELDAHQAIAFLLLGIALGLMIGMAIFRPLSTTNGEALQFYGKIYLEADVDNTKYKIYGGRLLKAVDPLEEHVDGKD